VRLHNRLGDATGKTTIVNVLILGATVGTGHQHQGGPGQLRVGGNLPP
jgi:hypothetical protein